MAGIFKMFNGSQRPQPRPKPSHPQDSNSIDASVMWENLYRDGYCILPSAISKREVDSALRAINCSLGKHAPNRQNPCPDCTNCEAIRDLYHKSSVKGVVEMLIGKHHHVSGGQIALRFPGDNTTGDYQVPPSWSEHWHIDGLGDYESKERTALFGDISNFTALIGVVLQDAEEDFMGNLTVYPGSHFELQNYFQVAGFEDIYREGVRGLPRIPFARGHKQIHAKAGDVIIANYCLAHNIAPNISPFIRYGVYFRVTSVAHSSHRSNPDRQLSKSFGPVNAITGKSAEDMKHRPESMLDVWLDWPGLRTHLSRTYPGAVAAPVVPGQGPTPSAPLAVAATFRLPSHGEEASSSPIATGQCSEDEELALALERSKHEK